MDRISAEEPERVTANSIESEIEKMPEQDWHPAYWLAKNSVHTIRSLESELEKAKAEIIGLNDCTDETINTLRERICAVEEASAIKGTMLHESEEMIKKLRAETAALKRQRDELVKAAENVLENPEFYDASKDYWNRLSDLKSAVELTVNSLGSGE